MGSILALLVVALLISVATGIWWIFWGAVLFLAVVFVLVFLVSHREKVEAQKAVSETISACRVFGIETIEDMTGIEFEKLVVEIMRRNGYHSVKTTKASGDYGVDIVAERGVSKVAVQCKHYCGSVGVSSVQQVYAGARMYGADCCIVATNSVFTQAAKNMAKQVGVELWDKDVLLRMMKTK